MRDVEIAERLRDRNHWWRHAIGWEDQDQSLREAAEAPFEYRPGVLDDLQPGPSQLVFTQAADPARARAGATDAPRPAVASA